MQNRTSLAQSGYHRFPPAGPAGPAAREPASHLRVSNRQVTQAGLGKRPNETSPDEPPAKRHRASNADEAEMALVPATATAAAAPAPVLVVVATAPIDVQLPTDCLRLIFMLLPLDGVARASRVSKEWEHHLLERRLLLASNVRPSGRAAAQVILEWLARDNALSRQERMGCLARAAEAAVYPTDLSVHHAVEEVFLQEGVEQAKKDVLAFYKAGRPEWPLDPAMWYGHGLTNILSSKLLRELSQDEQGELFLYWARGAGRLPPVAPQREAAMAINILPGKIRGQIIAALRERLEEDRLARGFLLMLQPAARDANQ